jgi:hypothetical protein
LKSLIDAKLKGAKAIFLCGIVIEECECVFGIGPPSQMPLAMVWVCLGFEVHLVAKHNRASEPLSKALGT